MLWLSCINPIFELSFGRIVFLSLPIIFLLTSRGFVVMKAYICNVCMYVHYLNLRNRFWLEIGS
jgi:Na+/H+ antiporter NhaB